MSRQQHGPTRLEIPPTEGVHTFILNVAGIPHGTELPLMRLPEGYEVEPVGAPSVWGETVKLSLRVTKVAPKA